MWLVVVAGICLAWYIFIALVCSIGYLQLLRHYSSPPKESVSSSLLEDEVPHVTIIRPCKGLEPYLYECLAVAFQQDYPLRKLTVHFCVSSRSDPACTVIQRVKEDFPKHDARLFVEDEDPALQHDGQGQPRLGPNPKIRNMSRAYREAKGDIVWILDCNVWVGKGACGRMVDKLCGFTRKGSGRPLKFAHHLPVVIDVDINPTVSSEGASFLAEGAALASPSGPDATKSGSLSALLQTRGGRLDELFMSSAHAKFYIAINSVAVAPCICGKSNMFRRSHLNYLTSPTNTNTLSTSDPGTSETVSTQSSVGIDHFSHNICEDHLIGDLLWRSSIPNEPNIGNHGLVMGELAVQPISGMSVQSYIARRVRWLRVRKFTVTLATLVEPGTESFLCSAYGAFAVTTLPGFEQRVGIPQTWLAFFICWLCSLAIWAVFDWTVYLLLQSGRTVERSEETIPAFARPLEQLSRRPFSEWFLAWLGREALALPVWTWAFYGGVTVVWRDRKFWVGLDMKVHEIGAEKGQVEAGNGHAREGSAPSKGIKLRLD